MSFGRLAAIFVKVIFPLVICTGVLVFLFAAIKAENQDGIIVLSLALLFSLIVSFRMIRNG